MATFVQITNAINESLKQHSIYMKMKTTFLILSVLICTISSAQINGPTVKFPSPSAAELGRFSATKVGLYTGTAQYSIPIYEFKTPNLTIPITLDYSSNGLMFHKSLPFVTVCQMHWLHLHLYSADRNNFPDRSKWPDHLL